MPSEWRQSLWPFAFTSVTANRAKEMVWYKYSSLVSSLVAGYLVSYGVFQSLWWEWPWHGRQSVAKGQSRAGTLEAACLGPTPAPSLPSCMILDKSLYYIGTKYVIGRFWEFSELYERIRIQSPWDNALQSKHQIRAWDYYYVPWLIGMAWGLEGIHEDYF